jgi:hypothetical protein
VGAEKSQIDSLLLHADAELISSSNHFAVHNECRHDSCSDLFEAHLTVIDLQRSLTFFSKTLGLELAEVFWDRRVAFYWIGGRGNSLLGPVGGRQRPSEVESSPRFSGGS